MVDFIRRFYLMILLALTVAVPYVLLGESTGPVRDKLRGMFAGQSANLEPVKGIDDPEVSRLLALQQQATANVPVATAATQLTPVVPLDGVLRFDVNPRWVMQYWPHVSTTRTDGQLDGLRVPLITGTGPSDTVGSLTYYFDGQQQVQRISMDGVTGDDRRLVTLATQVFQLKPEPQAGVGVYVSRWNGKPISALWVRRMPVVHSRDGAQQYEFSLELNRPGNNHGMSPRLEQRIQNAHARQESISTFR